MSKENKQNSYEMEIAIKTDLGSLTAVYDYKDALEAFESDFQEFTKDKQGVVDSTAWMIYCDIAEEALKELIEKILEDALKQVWIEAEARTINELNDTPFFLKHKGFGDGKEINKISAVKLPAFSSKSVSDFCEDVKNEAYDSSSRRLEKSRGGSCYKIGGYNFAVLDNYYERYYPQGKSILTFYKWKREQWENMSHSNKSKGNAEWNEHFLEIMFKINRNDVKHLREKLTNSKTKKERVKFEKLNNAISTLFSIESEDLELWKKTFIDLPEGFSFSVFTPEDLTYHFLATALDGNANTIKSNHKKLKKQKKEYAQSG